MTDLVMLRKQIEEVRKQLDEAALNGLNDGRFYQLSLKMDKLLEEYLDATEEST